MIAFGTTREKILQHQFIQDLGDGFNTLHIQEMTIQPDAQADQLAEKVYKRHVEPVFETIVVGATFSSSLADLKHKLKKTLTPDHVMELCNRCNAKDRLDCFAALNHIESASQTPQTFLETLDQYFDTFQDRNNVEKVKFILTKFREKWSTVLVADDSLNGSQVFSIDDMQNRLKAVYTWHDSHPVEEIEFEQSVPDSPPNPNDTIDETAGSSPEIDDYPKYRSIDQTIENPAAAQSQDKFKQAWDHLAEQVALRRQHADAQTSECQNLIQNKELLYLPISNSKKSKVLNSNNEGVAAKLMHSYRLERLFNTAPAQPGIAIVGDIMLDMFLTNSKRGARPDIAFVANGSEFKLGGAAKVAWLLHRLGTDCTLIGVIGSDVFGDRIIRMLTEEGISTDGILRDDRPTTLKIRSVMKPATSGAPPTFVNRVDVENITPIMPNTESMIFSLLTQFVQKFPRDTNGRHSALVVKADFGKGVITESLLQKIHTSFNGIVAFVSETKPRSAEVHKALTGSVIRVSHVDLDELKDDDPDEWRKCINTLEAFRAEDVSVIVNSGADGSHLYQKSHTVFIPPLSLCPSRAKVEALGAGDCYLAGAVYSYARGLETITSCVFGAITSELYCKGFIESLPGESFKAIENVAGKVTTVEHLLRTLGPKGRSFGRSKQDGTKDESRSIIATSGRFDSFHWNHYNFLKRAKLFGDILVVFILDDQAHSHSQESLKPSVHCNPYDRALVVAAVRTVDHVVVIDDSQLFQVITQLQPDVFCKGTNIIGRGDKALSEDPYSLASIRGNLLNQELDAVEQYGGKFILVSSGPVTPFYSEDVYRRRTRNKRSSPTPRSPITSVITGENTETARDVATESTNLIAPSLYTSTNFGA